MSQTVTKKVWVGGIYNWNVNFKEKAKRREIPTYPRHNWGDLDTTDENNFKAVLKIFEDNKICVVSQRIGKGFHIFGDLLPYEKWLDIQKQMQPHLDPNWPDHCLRITRKKSDEVWERPIFHANGNEMPKWARSLMSFLSKVLRNENHHDIWNAIHHVGLDKYWQCTCYSVELR